MRKRQFLQRDSCARKRRDIKKQKTIYYNTVKKAMETNTLDIYRELLKIWQNDSPEAVRIKIEKLINFVIFVFI